MLNAGNFHEMRLQYPSEAERHQILTHLLKNIHGKAHVNIEQVSFF